MARPLWEQYAEVSARFADDRGDRLHSGTDFNSYRLKEEFTTPVWGPIVRNGGDSVFGNYTIQRIEALNGLGGTNWYMLFGHQDSRSPHPYGHWLKPDGFMGWVGATGQVAGANPWHLHVGLASGDDKIGPSAFWAGAATLHDPLPLIRAAIDGHPWQSPWGPVWVNGEPPKPLGPKQRRTAKATNIRPAPTTDAPILGAVGAGAVLDIEATTIGQEVDGNSLWYYRDGQFFWSGAFTEISAENLPEWKPAPEAPTEPTPAPEEPTVPEPEAPPVDERPRYPVPAVETSHALAAAELASTLLPTRARSIVYIVYGLAGVALGATTTWLTATSQLAPEALIGATAVYGYLGAFVAVLAKANVPPAAQPEADE